MCFPEWLEAGGGEKCLQGKEGRFQFVRTLCIPLHMLHALLRVDWLMKVFCCISDWQQYCSYICPGGSGEQQGWAMTRTFLLLLLWHHLRVFIGMNLKLRTLGALFHDGSLLEPQLNKLPLLSSQRPYVQYQQKTTLAQLSSSLKFASK